MSRVTIAGTEYDEREVEFVLTWIRNLTEAYGVETTPSTGVCFIAGLLAGYGDAVRLTAEQREQLAHHLNPKEQPERG